MIYLEQGCNMTDVDKARIALLEAWLHWVMDNCDDSPEWNFGTTATNTIRAVLANESQEPPAALQS